MRQWTAVFLAAIILSSMAGCAKTVPPVEQSSLPTQSEQSSQPVEQEEPPIAERPEEEGDSFVMEDSAARLNIRMDKREYTLESVINMEATITNIGERPLVYVKGSGSNILPDALELNLGGFAGLFYPLMQTMDYQTVILQPGETTEMELPFVPYIPKGDDKYFGNDKDLEFFQSDDFTPATLGKVEGTVRFSYAVIPEGTEDDIQGLLEEENQVKLEGTIYTDIV